MKISRRKLLAGGIVALLVGPSKAYIHGSPLFLILAQGALAGGGFIKTIFISTDGNSSCVTYDGAGAWIWDAANSVWANVLTQDKIPAAYRTWGQTANNSFAYSAYGFVPCPSLSMRLYLVTLSNQGVDPGKFWRSDDRGLSWNEPNPSFTVPAYQPGTLSASDRGIGPSLAVDPANPDIVYIADVAGCVHRSTDGGSTWKNLNKTGNELASALTATAASATATSGNVLTFAAVPAIVTNRSGNLIYPFDIDADAALPFANGVVSATGTTVTLTDNIGASPGVTSGDKITFGVSPCIVFDPSSVSGGKCQTIYIGWAYGSTGVWVSTDGGATFSLTSSGPTNVRNLACSADGVLYACDNGTTGTPGATNAWKYQSSTWTNFSINAGNFWNSCAADPLNNGHVIFANNSSGVQFSSNYGSTWYGSVSGHTRTAVDVPWLATTVETFMTNGTVQFDPVVSGRAWNAEGIGVWYFTPATPTITMNSQNLGEQGLIVDQILKVPSGPLMVAVQDRCGFALTSLTSQPANTVGILESIPASIGHGWAVDYAKDDPTFIAILMNQNIWISSMSGANGTFSKLTAQVPSVNNGGAIAVQTSQKMVWFPSNNPSLPGYTTDGGATWTSCLFAGSTLNSGWAFSQYLNRHIVCADLVDGSTYYAFNYNNNSTGGLWRSTDNGTNWANMTGGISGLLTSGSDDLNLIAIPANQGHIFLSSGSAANNSRGLYRSVDSGATMVSVSNVAICWQIAVGAAKPGAAYPAIFFSGTIVGDSDPGIFRADNFTSDTSVEPIWTRLCRAPVLNMAVSKSLSGDLDTYGNFYLGTGSVGYIYGTLQY